MAEICPKCKRPFKPGEMRRINGDARRVHGACQPRHAFIVGYKNSEPRSIGRYPEDEEEAAIFIDEVVALGLLPVVKMLTLNEVTTIVKRMEMP